MGADLDDEGRHAASVPGDPGHEFWGEVAAIGTGVVGFAVGDLVFGMNDWFGDGTQAEFCGAPAG